MSGRGRTPQSMALQGPVPKLQVVAKLRMSSQVKCKSRSGVRRSKEAFVQALQDSHNRDMPHLRPLESSHDVVRHRWEKKESWLLPFHEFEAGRYEPSFECDPPVSQVDICLITPSIVGKDSISAWQKDVRSTVQYVSRNNNITHDSAGILLSISGSDRTTPMKAIVDGYVLFAVACLHFHAALAMVIPGWKSPIAFEGRHPTAIIDQVSHFDSLGKLRNMADEGLIGGFGMPRNLEGLSYHWSENKKSFEEGIQAVTFIVDFAENAIAMRDPSRITMLPPNMEGIKILMTGRPTPMGGQPLIGNAPGWFRRQRR